VEVLRTMVWVEVATGGYGYETVTELAAGIPTPLKLRVDPAELVAGLINSEGAGTTTERVPLMGVVR
jgi:hypothetical protein